MKRPFTAVGVSFALAAAFITLLPAISGASESGASESERAIKGYQLVREGKVDEGLALLHAEAANKSHWAMWRLGKIYNDTSGRLPIEPDPDVARCWLRKSGALFAPPPIVLDSDLDWNLTAARHGYAGAQLAMAYAYADGKLIERDMIEAGAWFILSYAGVRPEYAYPADETALREAIATTLKNDEVESVQARARELRDLPTMNRDFPCPLSHAE